MVEMQDTTKDKVLCFILKAVILIYPPALIIAIVLGGCALASYMIVHQPQLASLLAGVVMLLFAATARGGR